MLTHLGTLDAQAVICTWHAGALQPGDDRTAQINAKLRTADLIALLVSAAFLASRECRALMATALKLHRRVLHAWS